MNILYKRTPHINSDFICSLKSILKIFEQKQENGKLCKKTRNASFLVQANGPSSPVVMFKAWYTKIESSIIWLEDVLEGPVDIVDLLLHLIEV